MKRILYLLFAVSTLWSCNSDYDDSALTGRVDDLENRVAKLEELCKQMNTNISSLQTLVDALQNKDYITGVVPITKDGETIGYTISFTQSAPITIYNGQDGKDGQDGKPGEDGKDGSTPVIGVKQDADGIYYWTLNGDWLTDDSGNKIKAEGKDGQEGQTGAGGITPKLKIENDYWYVSYNNGASWSQLSKATGDKGDKGDTGDSIFKTVDDNDDSVVFTLHDGTTITIPKVQIISFDITFDNIGNINIKAGETYEVNYTIIGADKNTVIEAFASTPYEAQISATDFQSGKIILSTPADDLIAGKIIVFVSTGSNTIMRVINIIEGIMIVSDDTIEMNAIGGTTTTQIETNLNYTVDIPKDAQDWISVVETRTATRKEILTLKIQENTSDFYRYATINLLDENKVTFHSILIGQEGVLFFKTVNVETAGTLGILLTTEDKDTTTRLKIKGTLNDADFQYIREMPQLESLDIGQVSNTTLPDGCLKESIINTIVLPASLTIIPESAFESSSITTISFPNSLAEIRSRAFWGCKKLNCELSFPPSLKVIENQAFTDCSSIHGDLIIPDNVIELGYSAFAGCYSIGPTITIGNGIRFIPYRSFRSCTTARTLIVGDAVDSIGEDAFYFHRFTKIILGCGLKYIGERAFASSEAYRNSTIYCNAPIPPYFICNGTNYDTISLAIEIISNRDSFTMLYKHQTSHPRGNYFKNVIVPAEYRDAYQRQKWEPSEPISTSISYYGWWILDQGGWIDANENL